MDLDKFLDSKEAAAWLGITREVLVNKKIKGRNPIIQPFRLGNREYKFHPRTIIAKLAKDSGVPYEVIAASLNKPKENSQSSPF